MTKELFANIQNVTITFLKDVIAPHIDEKRFQYLARFQELAPTMNTIGDLFAEADSRGKKAKDLKQCIEDNGEMIDRIWQYYIQDKCIPSSSYESVGEFAKAFTQEYLIHLEEEAKLGKDDEDYNKFTLRKNIYEKYFCSSLNEKELNKVNKLFDIFESDKDFSKYITEEIGYSLLSFFKRTDGLRPHPDFISKINQFKNNKLLFSGESKFRTDNNISTPGILKIILKVSGLEVIQANRLGNVIVSDKRYNYTTLSNRLITYLRQGEFTTRTIREGNKDNLYEGIHPASVDQLKLWAANQSDFENCWEHTEQILKNSDLFEYVNDDKWQLIWPELGNTDDDDFRRIVRILYEHGKPMREEDAVNEYNRRCRVYAGQGYNIPPKKSKSITVRQKRFPGLEKTNGWIAYKSQNNLDARHCIYNYFKENEGPHTKDEIITECRRCILTVCEESLIRAYIPELCALGTWPNGAQKYVLKDKMHLYPEVTFRTNHNKREDVLPIVFDYLKSRGEAKLADINRHLRETRRIEITPKSLETMITGFNTVFQISRSQASRRDGSIYIKLISNEKPDFSEGKNKRNVPHANAIAAAAIEELKLSSPQPLDSIVKKARICVPEGYNAESYVRTVLRNNPAFRIERDKKTRLSSISLVENELNKYLKEKYLEEKNKTSTVQIEYRFVKDNCKPEEMKNLVLSVFSGKMRSYGNVLEDKHIDNMFIIMASDSLRECKFPDNNSTFKDLLDRMYTYLKEANNLHKDQLDLLKITLLMNLEAYLRYYYFYKRENNLKCESGLGNVLYSLKRERLLPENRFDRIAQLFNSIRNTRNDQFHNPEYESDETIKEDIEDTFCAYLYVGIQCSRK